MSHDQNWLQDQGRALKACEDAGFTIYRKTRRKPPEDDHAGRDKGGSLLVSLPLLPENGCLKSLAQKMCCKRSCRQQPPEDDDGDNNVLVTTLQLVHLFRRSSALQLPPEIGLLKNLERLDIFYANMHELPSELGELEKLTALRLHSCSLTKLPSEIGRLRNLRELHLSGCESMEHLPREIGELRELANLEIVFCPSFKQLPREIGSLKLLEFVELHGCKPLVSLPSELGGAENLRTLCATDCESLACVPKEILELRKLEILDLSGCPRLETTPQAIVDCCGPSLRNVTGLKSSFLDFYLKFGRELFQDAKAPDALWSLVLADKDADTVYGILRQKPDLCKHKEKKRKRTNK